MGTYTLYITAQGNAMTTTTRIDKNADGTYGGTLTADGIPPLPVNWVTVTGKKVTIRSPRRMAARRSSRWWSRATTSPAMVDGQRRLDADGKEKPRP